MNKTPHIYALIIGTEILNRRRVDKHFDYLSLALQTKGFSLFASLTIKDDETLITNTLQMIKSDPDAILFCFGGIGSTPDDLTRQLSCDVFSDGNLVRHSQFEKDILERLNERAYPHPIKMADLPREAKLLPNPVNNMSGFYLQNRYFFMPGFPEMAQPMMDFILSNFIDQAPKRFTKAFKAECGEAKLIELMNLLPKDVELSSLPLMNDGNPQVEIQLESFNESLLNEAFEPFILFLNHNNIGYILL